MLWKIASHFYFQLGCMWYVCMSYDFNLSQCFVPLDKTLHTPYVVFGFYLSRVQLGQDRVFRESRLFAVCLEPLSGDPSPYETQMQFSRHPGRLMVQSLSVCKLLPAQRHPPSTLALENCGISVLVPDTLAPTCGLVHANLIHVT